MISDSSGETLVSVTRSAISHFNNIVVKEYVWSLVSSTDKIDKIIEEIKKGDKSCVLYTIVNDQLRQYLKDQCQKLKIPCIPILSRVIREISSFLGTKPGTPTKHYEVLSDDYYSRIDAMNYILAHDDGQGMYDIDEADIILVGPSRTSKSPTSIYLAYRGYKVANIPFVPGLTLPADNLLDKLVIGLIIDPDRLIEIRRNRMSNNRHNINNHYVSKQVVAQEIRAAKEMFTQYKWPIIDVTQISIEEIAAKAIQYYTQHNTKK